MKRVFILLCIAALPLLASAQNESNNLETEKGKAWSGFVTNGF